MPAGSHDVTIIRSGRRRFTVFCENCQKAVSIFTSQQVSIWLAEIKTGQTEPIETGHGSIICRCDADIR